MQPAPLERGANRHNHLAQAHILFFQRVDAILQSADFALQQVNDALLHLVSRAREAVMVGQQPTNDQVKGRDKVENGKKVWHESSCVVVYQTPKSQLDCHSERVSRSPEARRGRIHVSLNDSPKLE